jgi:hypothetical protein
MVGGTVSTVTESFVETEWGTYKIVWPEGMDYWVRDANGAAWFYESSPIPQDTEWTMRGPGRIGCARDNNFYPQWRTSMERRTGPKLVDVEWSRLADFVLRYWEPARFPSPWIPWNVPGGNEEGSNTAPVPNGLLLELVPFGTPSHMILKYESNAVSRWNNVRAFRVTGVAPGYRGN